MASGMPDYNRVFRPRYGAALEVRGGIIAVATTKNELTSVTGKGMIYGGAIWIEGLATQFRGVPSLSVEGVDIGESHLDNLEKYNLNVEHCAPLYLLKYDDVNWVYVVGISHGITFETGFKLFYREWEGDTPQVGFFCIYALI